MENQLYKLMLSNIYTHVRKGGEDSYNTFTLTSALAILVCKTKEDVMNDYLNYVKENT